MKRFSAYKTLLLGAAAALVAGCASIGRPGGGPRDEKPPVYVRSNPAQGARNVNTKRIELTFNENIQLDDAFNKVIVSPTQTQSPVVRSNGRNVSVELRDSLVPDATYTIDFGDAIKDLNEGNVLDGFALDFATGGVIDSLRVSGILFDARTLEPAQGVLVGVQSNLSDSALYTLPLDRVARTNSRGQFTVRGLKPGNYRVVAINDVNRDNRWDRSEDIAFYDLPVSPSVTAIEVNDTLRSSADTDSIVTRPGVAYLPADILLTWFNEGYQSHYLKEHKRPERRRVNVQLSAPWSQAPSAAIVNTPALDGVDWNDITVPDITPGNDTVTWWIRDSRALSVDSLSLALTYPRTDSLDNVIMTTDTLKFFYRPSSDEIKKARERDKLRKKNADTIPEPQVFMNLRVITGTEHDVYMPLIFESDTPWDIIDTTKIRFTTTADSVWTPVPHSPLHQVDGKTILQHVVDFTPVPGQKYRFEVDSAAIADIYGNVAKAIKHEFTVKTLDKYTSIDFALNPAVAGTVVELLDGSDNPVRIAVADSTGHVVFRHLTPATYYARLYFDTDGDGKWTTGSVNPPRQPEETAYYPKKIETRANWDVNIDWPIYDTPLDMQKPYAILKNRPKLKKGEKAPGSDEDTEETDEWGNPINRRDASRGTTNGFGNFGGGLQQNTGNTSGNLRR